MRIDERDKVNRPRFLHALDLPQLDAEELHERAVLPVTEIVAVAHHGQRDAEPLPDVRLRERARDPVRIGVASEGDEDVLPLRRRKELRERAGTIGGHCGGEREAADGFAHGHPRIVAPFRGCGRGAPSPHRLVSRVWKLIRPRCDAGARLPELSGVSLRVIA